MNFNPMYYYVTFFRSVMLNGTVPDPVFILTGFGLAVLMLLIGLFVFKRKQDKFVLYI